MTKNTAPALWLLILFIALPQISETVYAPSLPDIARYMSISDSTAEYTLTVFLLGFALGTLFWGKISDRFGRRPCMLISLCIFALGCMGCYLSQSIGMLFFFRFIQAFGGSTGSVLGQAICRDAFQGKERGKVFSTISSFIAFSPAIGAALGGMIDQLLGWNAIFIFLIITSLVLLITTYFKLPETHIPSSVSVASIRHTAWKMANDKRILAFGFLSATNLGILISYYAEGSFYLIEMLGLTPWEYGVSFLGIACSGAIGGYISRRLHDHMTPVMIIHRGVVVMMLGATVFALMTLVFAFTGASQMASIILTLVSMIVISAGTSMCIPNVLSTALEDYRYAIGTASSLFGFYYYIIVALLTFGMGWLHNGTLLPMPLYLWAIVIAFWFVFTKFIKCV